MKKVREKAFEVLCAVVINQQYSNLSLRNQPDSFDSRDQSLINEIVYGTLQNYSYLTFQWQRFVAKKPSEVIGCLLNMSIYQLFFLDKIPDYAILDETIDIAKKIGRGHESGFCNALLRRVIREGLLNIDTGDAVNDLAVSTSHPLWLVQMWKAHYGWEITEQLCHYDNTHQPQALRVNQLKIAKADLLKDERFSNGRLADSAVYYSGNILSTSYFTSGEILIQDEASQLVSLFCQVEPGQRILDMCSAPGTKATHLVELMHDQGEVVALDIHAHRVALIEQLIAKLDLHCIKPQVMDALEVSAKLENESFDLVLLDAPCSGLGVLRHKPEIKLTVKPETIDQLVRLQSRLLDQAVRMVKPQGFIVYATCTLDKKENSGQISQFVQRNKQFRLLEEKTVLPMDYGCDGFFMAKLQRIE
ncbi:MAG: 16S rRNA (cytosine(967)-C(5))-methyltransferase RsmB [Erysipelotrichaceae bacterium]|nr:16S rRNA (cytosine(967)-C(5))-methyltransferase RsmB [Erysipelotrichaceae bacterium]